MQSGSSAPLYRQVSDDLKRLIDDGSYQPGRYLPTERELMIRYHVSRITVRRAVEELCEHGYLVKWQGRGTYVRGPRLQRCVTQRGAARGFTELCRAQGVRPGAHVLLRELVPCDAVDAAFFDVAEGTWCVHVRRGRTADALPIFDENVYVPHTWAAALLERDLEDVSLFSAIEETTGKRVADISHFAITAANATLEQARLLDVPPKTALLNLHVRFSDVGGDPVCVGNQYYVGGRFAFELFDR